MCVHCLLLLFVAAVPSFVVGGKSQQERKKRTFIVMTEVLRFVRLFSLALLFLAQFSFVRDCLCVCMCEGGFKWSISSRLPPSEKRMVVVEKVSNSSFSAAKNGKKQLRKTSPLSLRGLWRSFRPLSHRITTHR